MKKIEIVLIGLSILATVLQIFGLPGGSMILIMSLGTLSVLYFLFGVVLFNNKTVKEAVDNIPFSPLHGYTFKNFGIGTVLSVATMGILFKSLSFPGASVLLLAGVLGTGISALVTYKKKKDNTPFILQRLIGFGGYCLLLFLIM